MPVSLIPSQYQAFAKHMGSTRILARAPHTAEQSARTAPGPLPADLGSKAITAVLAAHRGSVGGSMEKFQSWHLCRKLIFGGPHQCNNLSLSKAAIVASIAVMHPAKSSLWQAVCEGQSCHSLL